MAIIRLALTTAFLFAVQAGAAEISISGLRACTKLTDDQARLACFDREMATVNTTATRGDANVSSSQPKLTAEQKLGLPQQKIDKLEAGNNPAQSTPVTKLQAHLTATTLNSANRKIFFLDNGQVWQQIEADTAFAVHDGDPVEISKGAFGSFFLSAGKHASTRVTRVR